MKQMKRLLLTLSIFASAFLFVSPIGIGVPYADTRSLLALVGLYALFTVDFRSLVLRLTLWIPVTVAVVAGVVGSLLLDYPLHWVLCGLATGLLGLLGCMFIELKIIPDLPPYKLFEPYVIFTALMAVVSLVGSLTGWYDISNPLLYNVYAPLALVLLGSSVVGIMTPMVGALLSIMLLLCLYYSQATKVGIGAFLVLALAEWFHLSVKPLYTVMPLIVFATVIVAFKLPADVVVGGMPMFMAFSVLSHIRRYYHHS